MVDEEVVVWVVVVYYVKQKVEVGEFIIFDKIILKEIFFKIVYEDDDVFVFCDVLL